MNQIEFEKHSIGKSTLLHLLPGLLLSIFYFLMRPIVISFGFPPVFALVIAVMFILIPIELGYLLYQGKKKSGRYTFTGIIDLKKMTPWWQHLILLLFTFAAVGALMALLAPVETFLKERLFFWIPGPDNGLDGNFSKTNLIITFSLFLLIVVILGPIVEELYFRGYLLPRIKGRFAVLFHSFLFALYHFFTPWLIISRTVSFIPMILLAKHKSIYDSMVVHILGNLVGVLTAFVFILNMK